ncbi:MAG: hypothetical protein H6621_08515 [Halobacteriovoraceae bacterium]|nr:hypothetical protein [Halobacteriovoraceae bacterium]MCB9095095.1 hypothetical protein [Halobacteriovoraceae bacterium]
MRKLCKFFICTVLFLSIDKLFAYEQSLVTITSDVFGKDEFMELLVEEGSHGEIQTIHKDYYDKDGVRLYRDSYSADSIEEGISLYKSDDRDVITIIGNRETGVEGGPVDMDYLLKANIFDKQKDEREVEELEIEKTGSHWNLKKRDRAIAKMHFLPRKNIMGMTIGIKDIEYK